MAVDIFAIAKPMLSAGPAFIFSIVLVFLATVFTIIRQKRANANERQKSSARYQGVTDQLVAGKWPAGEDIEDKEVERVVAEAQGKRDPVEFCEHIPGEIKRVKQRLTQEKAEAEMDEDERAREYEARRSQMEAIFQLLQSQEDKFGIGSMDDMESQMKLYVQ